MDQHDEVFVNLYELKEVLIECGFRSDISDDVIIVYGQNDLLGTIEPMAKGEVEGELEDEILVLTFNEICAPDVAADIALAANIMMQVAVNPTYLPFEGDASLH